jgi:hypothetical protein
MDTAPGSAPVLNQQAEGFAAELQTVHQTDGSYPTVTPGYTAAAGD